MLYSADTLNRHGDSIQPWHTHFPIWNQSVVPCPVLTVASWPAYRFLKRQVRWSSIPISFRIFHSLLWSIVKGFGIVNKAEVDVFLELSCFFNDPADVGNLISGSSAFSKTCLNIFIREQNPSQKLFQQTSLYVSLSRTGSNAYL